jgi:hypothetical protein
VIILAIILNMRSAAIAALLVCFLGAEPWPLDRLFMDLAGSDLRVSFSIG